jgi:hypothetical protein
LPKSFRYKEVLGRGAYGVVIGADETYPDDNLEE